LSLGLAAIGLHIGDVLVLVYRDDYARGEANIAALQAKQERTEEACARAKPSCTCPQGPHARRLEQNRTDGRSRGGGGGARLIDLQRAILWGPNSRTRRSRLEQTRPERPLRLNLRRSTSVGHRMSAEYGISVPFPRLFKNELWEGEISIPRGRTQIRLPAVDHLAEKPGRTHRLARNNTDISPASSEDAAARLRGRISNLRTNKAPQDCPGIARQSRSIPHHPLKSISIFSPQVSRPAGSETSSDECVETVAVM